MKHYGDITKINGADVEPVWIITGGSPCQDLSVAGKRAGLAGERSGLFMEQIRIIKEMREHDKSIGRSNELIRPRYMVWENVPGAFSSNGGEDFRAVLEETARVAERDAVIPGLKGKQKWTKSGCIMGDGWSIAWRVHDAQFWGVPQRRKRIALVADFGGQSAAEILFEREGMPGDTEESGKEREGTACDAEESADVASWGFEPGAARRLDPENRFNEELSPTLRSEMGDNQIAVVYGMSSFDSNDMKSSNPHSGIYEAETSRTLDLNGGNPACNQGGMMVVQSAGQEHGHQPIVLEGNGSRPSHRGDGYAESETMYTLNSTEYHAVCVENHPADSRVKISDDGIVQTLSSRMGTGGGNVPMVMYPEKYVVESSAWDGGQVSPTLILEPIAIVRRLTPLECERLQGYPDHWTNIGDWVDSKGKLHKGDADSPRYKALGNSIALPFWSWMATRMCALLRDNGTRDLTMASLFDGIGGFPLVFKRCGCIPVWASEIEEFPIAVTKIRFPEYD